MIFFDFYIDFVESQFCKLKYCKHIKNEILKIKVYNFFDINLREVKGDSSSSKIV